MSKKIGLVLALDGEKEFKQQITSVNKSISSMKSELGLVTAQYEGNANTLEALTKKYEIQNRIYEEQKKKLDTTRSALGNAEKKYESMGKTVGGMKALFSQQNSELDKLKQSYESAKQRLQKMTEEGNSSEKAMQKQRGTVAALENAVKAQEERVDKCNTTLVKAQNEYRKCGNYVNDWRSKLNTAEAQTVKAQRELNRYAEYMNEAEQSADKCATSIDKFGKAAKEVVDLKIDKKTGILAGVFEGIGEAAAKGGLGTIGKAVGAASDAVKDSMLDLSSASADLAAKTGLSEEAMQRYRDVMTEIKGDNFGESYGDVADVMAEIVQIMGEMDPSAMKDATESAITLRDTFDMDVNESIRAVDVMMKTMGVDSKTAFDLIARGAQNGLDRSHELTDNITEYGQLWGQMGFSAEEMFSILENGLDSGAYNLDKVNDYVKEFGVSLADGRIEKNIDKFSDGTKKLFGQWKDGEASARDVFYSVIGDLSEMTDQQEALTIASDTWSALGEDNAMQVITALDDVNTAYSNVQGTMDKLKETKYSDLESAVSQLGASVQENVLTPIAEKALPLITKGVELATGAIEGVGAVLNPAKEDLSAFSQYVQDTSTEIQETNEATKKAVEEAKGSFDAAVMDSDEIGALGERLMELNSVEQLTTTQKAEMQAIVAELSKSIPELSGAYDAENGKLSKTNEELAALVKNYQNAAIAQAATAATQELVNAQMEATVNKVKAESLRDMLENERDVIEQEYMLYQEMAKQENYSVEEGRAEAIKIWKQALDEGKISLDQYQAAIDSINTKNTTERISALDDRVDGLTDGIEEQNLAIKDSENVIKDCGEEIGVVTKAQEEMASEAEAATSKVNGLSEAMGRGMPTDVAEKMAGALSGVSDAYDETAEAAEDAAEASEDAAEKVKTGAETQKEAIQGVLDTYHGYVDEIESDLQSKVSLFDKFDGGDDSTIEQINENLLQQKTAIDEYAENLDKVRQRVGKEISPAFMNEIESMGPEAANLLKHICITLDDELGEGWEGVSETVKTMSDTWVYNMDKTEDIAKVGGANRVALEAAMRDLGSTTVEFDGLKDALNEALEKGLADESAAVEAGFLGAVETAREMGVRIPEGLAEGIASGGISPEQAVEQLNGAMQGSLEGLAQVATDVGLGIPDDVADAIESGDPAKLSAAYDKLISHITDSADPEALKQAADQLTEGYTTEVEAGSDAAGSAGESLAQAGADAASEKQSEFKTAGDDAGTAYAEALRAHLAEAAQAAGALASAAQNAVMSYRNAFENAGYNLSAGVAQGISNGTNLAVNAAVNMMRQTLAATKKEPEIASPSKKFRREVGQQIANGVAFGIRDKASLAGQEATKMSAQVYGKATAWLSKYKKSHKLSLDDEKYYWDEVLQHVKKGTEAYNNAIKKLATATFSGTGLSGNSAAAALRQVESNFGVSRTKTTGSGKNQKTVKKDAEAYYSEIYNAANKYLSNMQTLNDWSLDAELRYWQAVQAQLKKGTQAWYDATRQVKDLQVEIAEAQQEAAEAAKEAEEERVRTLQNVHSKMLNQYKTYYQVSAKAEMDYWDIARQQFTEGTDARIEADQAYFDAREEYYDQLAELDEDYAEKKQKVDDELADSIKDLQDAYDNAVKDREREIKSSMNLFEAWDADGWQPDKLMANLKTQVEGLQFWEQQLDELAGKGVTQELMDELAAMGPDAAANLWSLNQMTAEQLDEYQRLWADKNNLAHKQALEDNKNLLKETQDSIAEARKAADEELAKLKADYDDAVAKLNTGLSDGLKSLVTQAQNVGEEIVSTLVEAVRNGMTDVTGLVAQAQQQAQATPATAAPAAPAPAAPAAPAAEAAEAQQEAARQERDKILDIINSGTKRKKKITAAEKKEKSDLWQYIVSKYGMEPTTNIYRNLGEALGVDVSDGVGAAVRNKILKKLKSKGYATGTRNIWRDELAWMLENAKTEYVIRKADNAILQPMRAGDKVINPKGAENLYDFAENPSKFISTRARDALAAAQEAMQKRQDEIRSQIPELSYGGITRLNRLMESGMQAAPVVNVDNKELVSMMQQMVSGMQAIMGQVQELQERQIVMDSGALVGALQQPMSRANASVQRRRNRGTLR